MPHYDIADELFAEAFDCAARVQWDEDDWHPPVDAETDGWFADRERDQLEG